MLPETMKMEFFGEGLKTFLQYEYFMLPLIGLVVGGVISSVTEYYTGLGTKPVLAIVQKSSTGAGTNVIAGLATGMISTFQQYYYLLVQFGLLMLWLVSMVLL
jgi:K(+)-stimulated pyrophosphate-energized sodium pump